MARGITITWASSRYIYGKHDGIRVRIWVTAACEMDERIFAYRMLPVNPQTGAEAGFFSHICSPPDIEEFPEDEPIESHRPKWFRLSYVDILVRSVAEADNFVECVREDVRRLKRTLDTMDTLIPGGEEGVGAACPVEEPSSDSGSSEGSEPETSYGSTTAIAAVSTDVRSVGTLGAAWEASSPPGGTDFPETASRQALLHPGESSHMLLLQGFDFSELADDADIEGIEVRLSLRWVEFDDDFTFCPEVTFLALHQPEQGLVENRGEGQCVPGSDFDDITEGGDADLWSETWTASLLKRGEFGVALLVALPLDAVAEMTGATVEVEGVEITVYHRNPVS